MQRLIINFAATPLPPDIQEIILEFYAKLYPKYSLRPLSEEAREIVIGADIFGFLWKMLSGRNRMNIIGSLRVVHYPLMSPVLELLAIHHREALDNFMNARPSIFSHRLPLTGNVCVDKQWKLWGDKCDSVHWEEVITACSQYFMVKNMNL